MHGGARATSALLDVSQFAHMHAHTTISVAVFSLAGSVLGTSLLPRLRCGRGLGIVRA